MKKVTLRFFICNIILYAAVSVLRLALSLVSGWLGLSSFAVGALCSAAGTLMLPVVVYFVCRRFDGKYVQYTTKEARALVPALLPSVLALAAVPRVATTSLVIMSKNALDILLSSASFFVEYLPKFLLRGDYLPARLVGAAVWCAFVLVSYRVTARIADRRRDRWRTVRLRLDGRLALRLGGVLVGFVHFGYLALRAGGGGVHYGGIPTLISLMLVAATELMLLSESAWSLCVSRGAYYGIRFCISVTAVGVMLTCAWLSVSGVVLCNVALAIQILLAVFVRRKKMLSKNDIHEFLSANNIKSTDTVLVHTSFRSLGGVEGGCDGFIDAMCEYLSDGLFLVPTHTWANVTAESPVFDVRSTEPCIGVLPKTAAGRSDGVRSLHPTHSLVAFGARACEFVSGEENARTPCPVGGAWSRLYDERAKILLIGVGLNRNTYIHAIDEMIDLPDRLAEPVTLHVIGHEGEKYTFEFSKHAENTGSENFGVFEDALVCGGALRYSQLGGARVGIFDAVCGTEIIKKLWANADHDLTRDIETTK